MKWLLDILKLDIDYSKRILGLDYIRAFAAILVIFSHTFFLLHNFKVIEERAYYIWFILVSFTLELFFVLSGFLIGKMLINNILQKKDLLFSTKFQIIQNSKQILNNFHFFNLLIFNFNLAKTKVIIGLT